MLKLLSVGYEKKTVIKKDIWIKKSIIDLKLLFILVLY